MRLSVRLAILAFTSKNDCKEALLLYREAMVEHGGDHGNQHTGGKDNNVILAEAVQGNSRAYSLDRVVRECEPIQPEKPTTKNTEKPYRN